jgi:hypothetical protein
VSSETREEEIFVFSEQENIFLISPFLVHFRGFDLIKSLVKILLSLPGRQPGARLRLCSDGKTREKTLGYYILGSLALGAL